MTDEPPPGRPRPDRDNLSTSRLARFAVGVVVFGFFFFLVGIFPDLIRLGLTPGIGLLQIGAFLIGISVMTLGAYIYAYATRHRAMPRRLREDIGLRLMATGLVIAYATGFADVLGIGSHFGADRPLFGLWQAAGVALGVFTIITGLILYARR
jgi:MFS family permease